MACWKQALLFCIASVHSTHPSGWPRNLLEVAEPQWLWACGPDLRASCARCVHEGTERTFQCPVKNTHIQYAQYRAIIINYYHRYYSNYVRVIIERTVTTLLLVCSVPRGVAGGADKGTRSLVRNKSKLGLTKTAEGCSAINNSNSYYSMTTVQFCSNCSQSTVEPLNKGQFGNNINSAVVFFVERLSSSWRFKMY